MPWVTITVPDDLNDARAAALVTAARTKSLDAGQTDPAPRIAQTVIDEIRGCIAFNQQNQLETDPTTIPASLKEIAVQKIVRMLKARLLQALTDDEKAAEALYQKRLEQLTNAEWPVDKPTTPLASNPVQPLTGYSGSADQIPL